MLSLRAHSRIHSFQLNAYKVIHHGMLASGHPQLRRPIYLLNLLVNLIKKLFNQLYNLHKQTTQSNYNSSVKLY